MGNVGREFWRAALLTSLLHKLCYFRLFISVGVLELYVLVDFGEGHVIQGVEAAKEIDESL
jgi:hypothetical protein